MKLEDAVIGDEVIYVPNHGNIEKGRITSIGNTYIFVEYYDREPEEGRPRHTSKATLPKQLFTIAQWEDRKRWREVYEETS